MVMTADEFRDVPAVVELEQEYRNTYQLLDTAVSYLRGLLDQFDSYYKSRREENAFISQEVRAKDWDSVLLKLWRELKNKRPEQVERKDVRKAYKNIHDLAGGRIEVSYLDKVFERAGVLKRYFAEQDFNIDLKRQGIEDHNYLEDDNQGYRAFHLFVEGSVENSESKKKTLFLRFRSVVPSSMSGRS